MKRKALIIGTPGDGVYNKELPGVDIDLANYRRYLRSPLGGAWFDVEIVVMHSPTSQQIQEELNTLREVDYAFVSFSGHGGYNTSTRSTHLELGLTDSFDSRLMKIGARKQTVVLDCCRELYTPKLLKSLIERASLESLATELDPRQCRSLFDTHVTRCLPASIVLNACDINETAGDSANVGGIYSASLIEAAEDFAKEARHRTSGNGAILDVPDAHARAVHKVRKESNSRQNPTIDQPRVSTYFPFAVIA